MSVTYKFPHASPIRYLPLVYMLPYDLLVRCPTLRKLPRNMGALSTSEWGEVIMSQQFLNEVMDAVASLAFPPLWLRRLEGALHGLVPRLALVLCPAPVGQGGGKSAGVGCAGPL